MTAIPNLTEKDLIEAHEASDVSAINGIVRVLSDQTYLLAIRSDAE